MTYTYHFRRATNDDLVPMMRIGHEGLRPHVEPLRGWNAELEQRGFLEHFEIDKIQIIVVDDVDVGYVKVVDHTDHCFIEGLYIGATHRSKGLGTTILKDLTTNSRNPVRLRVHKTNPARQLYERLGFKKIGETEDQYLLERNT
ncbi:MAG: GNAT family N-acetyltransferase [Pseudomonadota bacterium]